MALTALALAMPGVASAQHSSRHDARKARHHRHHHHARKITFAANVKTTTTTTPSAPSKTTTEPMPGSGEVVGTVTSFEGGVLKITLTDNSVVSGKVTERTELSCGTPQAGDDDGDDNGGQDGDDNGDEHGGQSQGDSHGGSSFSHHGDDEHGGITPPAEEVPVCGTSALVPGAKVHEAELSISSAGAVWDKVDLIQ